MTTEPITYLTKHDCKLRCDGDKIPIEIGLDQMAPDEPLIQLAKFACPTCGEVWLDWVDMREDKA